MVDRPPRARLTEDQWKHRLMDLAAEASHDDLPCIENTLLALMKALDLPRHPQLRFANLLHRLLERADEAPGSLEHYIWLMEEVLRPPTANA